MRRLLVLVMVLVVSGFSDIIAAAQSQAAVHKPAASAKSAIDDVIELVRNGTSETMIISILQRQGKAFSISTSDLVKLQKAGVSENIINVMLDPRAVVKTETDPPPNPATLAAIKDPAAAKGAVTDAAASVPMAPQPVVATVAADTPFPADLPNQPATRKRRVVVAAIGYGAIRNWVQSVYGTTSDIGEGIRAMLMTRLQQSNAVTVLERNNALTAEQQQGVTTKIDPGSRPKIGKILGADCLVTGDITIFGRDDKGTHTGGGGAGIGRGLGGLLGGIGETKKEEKAVVAIEFRIADAETSEVLFTASARGESIRKSKKLDFGGLGVGAPGLIGGAASNGTTSSNFEKTILGEATVDAVNQIVKQLEEKISQLPAHNRKIEGRVASIAQNGVYLALGSNDGVLPGDRFAILQINNEVLDPQTKETIDVETAKVGELVVFDVHDKSAIGNYGGHPLFPDYITSKGYLARLMSK